MIFPYWLFYFILLFSQPVMVDSTEMTENKPSDWFFNQRSFPLDTIPQSFYHEQVIRVQKLAKSRNRKNIQPWKFAGPTNIGGRITDIEASAPDPGLIYIGSASGGVFKTKDFGLTWTPIFDQNPILAIGDMAIHPSDPKILYVGTGEANGGGGSVAYDGNGIFMTNDGGLSWKYLGLEFSGSISKILIHPNNPQIVYAAAMGKLFSKNPQRGIYKSINGGDTWELIYFQSDSVGVIDMAMDIHHPDTLYAATWERSRNVFGINYGGAGSGIIRSFDGGKIWSPSTLGLPEGDNIGRIGLAVSSTEPNKIFAQYVDSRGNFLGIYRSDDFGHSWSKPGGRINSAGFDWWFGKIYVDPKDANIVYSLGLTAYKSTNGGQQFFPIADNSNEEVHVDQHALFIYPDNTNNLLLGNDGGLYTSANAGGNWRKINNLPITQFYTCHIDYSHPERLYGGTQDNSSMRTLTTRVDQWAIISGGDGFVCLVDPKDSKYVYTESQYGVVVRSTDGGASFFTALNGINGVDRKNWNSPMVFHPTNPATLFLGTDRLYRSDDRAVSWTSISPTLAPETGVRTYGTITTISVSPIDPQIIYCGTDVGKVWITANGGASWKAINEGLPQRWITSILADPIQKNRVYLTLSGYRYGESMPHVFVSDNNGLGWQDISRGLPPIPCNKIVADPSFSGHIAVATDAGVWRSYNHGQQWEMLGDGMPLTIVTDLDFNFPTRKLVAATYGRGIYTYDLELPVSISADTRSTIYLQAYPNPVTDRLNIHYTTGHLENLNLSIFTAHGNVIWSRSHHGMDQKTFTENLVFNYPPGVYFVSLQSGNFTKTIKIVKQ
jgi:photosystem II stability/assembly factor-like uncharacterized protein